MANYFKTKYRLLDKWVIIPYIILMFTSIIAVYSASSFSSMDDFGTPNYYLIRQIINVVVSFILFIVTYFFPFKRFKSKKMTKIGTLINFGMLVVVLFTSPRRGARRWLSLPFFNLQPAEFAKVFVIWYLAYIFSKRQKQLESDFIKLIAQPGLLVGFIFFLILFQPDTGTAIIIGIMTVTILSASGIALKYGLQFILFGVGLVASLFIILYYFGEYIPFLSYRYDRFLGVWDPFGYYDSYGHQLVHSYYALNRGSLFGVGIGNSVQKTGYLPFPYTDFIIAIIGEEIGLFGLTILLILLGAIIARAFYIGSQAKDSFVSLISIGVGSMLLVQSLFNMAGVTGMMPITGVTFPFLSYGGSSLMVVSISVALLANASTTNELQKMNNL